MSPAWRREPAARRGEAPGARSYYGRPIIKAPVWTPEIPVYFFVGGLAGASAGLAYLVGRRAARAPGVGDALAGASVSPALLISDLGVPSRFLHMLRMFKVTSPMSVGSWVLGGFSLATGGAAAHALTGRLPRTAAVAAPPRRCSGCRWRPTPARSSPTRPSRCGTRRVATCRSCSPPGRRSAPVPPRPCSRRPSTPRAARRLAVLGAIAELGSMLAMERRLGELGEPYATGRPATFKRLANGLVGAGAVAVAGWGRRSRPAAIGGGVAALSGAALARLSVFRAGFPSAADPKYVVGPQRARIDAGAARGAGRRHVTAP